MAARKTQRATAGAPTAAPAPVPARKGGRVRVALTATAVAVGVVAGTGTNPVPLGSYFADSGQRTGLEFITTGCALLDEVMGGGYALGRMSNIIGDKSTGKTLLAIEACGNFAKKFADGVIRYAEAEAAFDQGYAGALGMPLDRVQFADWKPRDKKADADASDRTVEWVFEDITETLESLNGRPCMYVVDSLDALSDRAELARGMDAGSYGMEKAKRLGELFRRLVGKMEDSRMCLIIISQVRDNIGVTFGSKYKRSGGHAMDFYATHCLWLSNLGQMHKTIRGIKRTIGVNIKAQCQKNKIGLPWRQCDFPILFGYGIDDASAHANWLVESKLDARLGELGMSAGGYKVRIAAAQERGGPELRELREGLARIVREEWPKLEAEFLPTARKY